MEGSVKIRKVNTISNVLLGKIPIVVKSNYCVSNVSHKECRYDPGGYVIINGNEKSIISQEKVCPNIIQVNPVSKGAKYYLAAEIRSVSDKYFMPPKVLSVKITNNTNNDNFIRVILGSFLIWSILLFLIIFGMIIDFNYTFTLFHKIMFTNDLWILDPNTDFLIMIFPQRFFLEISAAIIILFLLINLIIFFSIFSFRKFFTPR